MTPSFNDYRNSMLPLHKRVDENGRVRVLRVLNADGTSYDGFRNGLNPGDKIVCPDWEPTEIFGNGLHGWPWGHGRHGTLFCTTTKDGAGNRLWQVVLADPHTGIDLTDTLFPIFIRGGAKWPEFEVLYTGGQAECMQLLLPGLQEWVIANSESGASTSGDFSSASMSGDSSSASTSGYNSSASTSGKGSSASTSGTSSSANTSGDFSSASTSGYGSSANTSGIISSATTSGDFSSANTSGPSSSASTSGYNSSANTSDYNSSASSSGNSSSASTSGDSSFAYTYGHGSPASTAGDCSSASASGHASSAVCDGIDSRARSGPFGIIALAWWNEKLGHREMLCERVGDGNDDMLKPHIWYHVVDGMIVEC